MSMTALIMNSMLSSRRSGLITALAPVLKASFCILGSRISLHLRETVARMNDNRFENICKGTMRLTLDVPVRADGVTTKCTISLQ